MRHLNNVECELPEIWESAHHAHTHGSGVMYVDTEFVDKRLIQVAILDATGKTILDARIDHGLSIQELYDELPERGYRRAWQLRVLSRFYGPDSTIKSPMITVNELASKLTALRLSEHIMIEWSTNYCDYRMLAQTLEVMGKAAAIMPPVTHRVSGLHLYRSYILKKNATFALQAIYPFLLPNSKLIWNHHEAEVDTKKLFHVVELAFSVAKPFKGLGLPV